MSGSRSLFAGLMILAALAVAEPAAAENVLRYTSYAGGAVTFDPHAWLLEENRTATEQVYEALLDVDSNLQIVPQLAVEWKPINPTTWEFRLRGGVKFHDGTPFTAEDVVFSIRRARAETSHVDYVANLGRIAGVEVIDGETIRVATTAPDPMLWLKLSHVAIMSKRWADRHGVIKPANFKGAREETYASRHANGTGPFVLESFEPHGGWVMVRNTDWWGATEYPHNIDRIVHTWKTTDQENLADLLDRDIDLLQNPPYEALTRIAGTAGLKVATGRQLSGVYLGLDQGSAELRSSNVKGRNPFQDKRVRQAMYHAIDVGAILRPLMGDLAVPAGMLIPPGVNGYTAELDRRLSHDPERAKALLAEAGYPDGFSVTLDCPDEWGDDEMTTCRGAAAEFTAVGIEVAIEFLSTASWYDKVYKEKQSDFWLDATFTEPDSENVMRTVFHSGGSNNPAGYSNPRVDELIDKIETEMVTYITHAMPISRKPGAS